MKNLNLIWDALKASEFGSLSVELPDKTIHKFKGKSYGPNADISIKNLDAIGQIISGGDVGFGEAYMEGLWDSSDLAELLTFLTVNSAALEKFFHARKFQSLMLFLRNFFKKNTKKGSKKNISSHYDLGNEFYELWLDKTMTYSSAIFGDEKDDLEKAQIAKYQKILDKISNTSILEIGCGWGGFAEVALKDNYKIKCLTLSQKQKEYAQKRLNSFRDNFQISLQDYRDEKAVYDNVVSIEMFEAVGREYWQGFFNVLKNSLRPNGKAVLQVITIDEKVFDDYKNRVDFIQKHIFPGGVLPSKSALHQLAELNGFRVASEFAFGEDYSKTLKIWLNNFDQKNSEIKALGFSDQFIRKWRFYLAYCIAGFAAKRTDVVQLELIKK